MGNLFILVVTYGCGTIKTLQDTNGARIRDYYRHYYATHMGELIEVDVPTGWETWSYEAQETYALAKAANHRAAHAA